MEENPEIDPYIYGQLKEKSEKNSGGTTGYTSRKKKKNQHLPHTTHKNKLRLITDIMQNYKTLKEKKRQKSLRL